jgi:uncharacterized membrane protein
MIDPSALCAFVSAKILPPSDLSSNLQLLLRWIHFLAGITWIGLLYHFNLVAFRSMPKFELPVRSNVISTMMPPTMWWLRWSAVVTVLAGFIYWVLILRTEPPNDPGAFLVRTLVIWFVLVVVSFGIQMALLRIPTLSRHTWAFVIAILFLVGGQGHLMMKLVPYEGASNRALAIAVGGGIGLFLLFNVWGIVWRAQKRVIAWATEHPGEPPPADLQTRMRHAQLVSRASFWLTLPLLFFMAVASHYPLFSS